MKEIPIISGVFLILACFASSVAHAATYTGQCSAVNASKIPLVSKAVFNENLPPYGDVCLAAHVIPSPINVLCMPGYKPPPYIAVSLFKNGKDIFDFTYPNTPGELWPEAVDKILAVSFQNLNDDRYKDVILLGQSLDGRGNYEPRPLIFLGSKTGFKLLYNLSALLASNGDMTIPDIIYDINNQFGLNPPLPKDSN